MHNPSFPGPPCLSRRPPCLSRNSLSFPRRREPNATATRKPPKFTTDRNPWPSRRSRRPPVFPAPSRLSRTSLSFPRRREPSATATRKPPKFATNRNPWPSRRSHRPPVFPAPPCLSREGGNPTQPRLANHPSSPPTAIPGPPVFPAALPSFPRLPVFPAKAGTQRNRDSQTTQFHHQPQSLALPSFPRLPVFPAKAGTQRNRDSQTTQVHHQPQSLALPSFPPPSRLSSRPPVFPAPPCLSREGGNPAQPRLATQVPTPQVRQGPSATATRKPPKFPPTAMAPGLSRASPSFPHLPVFPAPPCLSREGGNPAQPRLANHPSSPPTAIPAPPGSFPGPPVFPWPSLSFPRLPSFPHVPVFPAKAGTQRNRDSQTTQVHHQPQSLAPRRSRRPPAVPTALPSFPPPSRLSHRPPGPFPPPSRLSRTSLSFPRRREPSATATRKPPKFATKRNPWLPVVPAKRDLCITRRPRAGLGCAVACGDPDRPSTGSEPAPDLIRGRTSRAAAGSRLSGYAKVSVRGNDELCKGLRMRQSSGRGNRAHNKFIWTQY